MAKAGVVWGECYQILLVHTGALIYLSGKRELSLQLYKGLEKGDTTTIPLTTARESMEVMHRLNFE